MNRRIHDCLEFGDPVSQRLPACAIISIWIKMQAGEADLGTLFLVML